MKLLITGDWHIRNTAPERRVDDYWTTVMKKIKYILDTARETDCNLILQPGDFFDSHRAIDFLKYYMIKRLKRTGIKVITVFGQHDLRYHSSDIRNTPLATLVAAKVAYTAPNWEPMDFGNLNIYGASWHENIPAKLQTKDGFNVLLMHKMVIRDEKVWEGQEDYKLGNILLKTLPFDLIVSGDNHKHFTIRSKSGLLINCGSLLRTGIDQISHQPVCYVYDTETDELIEYKIPIEPFEQVFDMTKVEEEKERNEKMELFVNKLTGSNELRGLNFTKNMDTYMRKNKEAIDETTREIIEEVMR